MGLTIHSSHSTRNGEDPYVGALLVMQSCIEVKCTAVKEEQNWAREAF